MVIRGIFHLKQMWKREFCGGKIVIFWKEKCNDCSYLVLIFFFFGEIHFMRNFSYHFYDMWILFLVNHTVSHILPPAANAERA